MNTKYNVSTNPHARSEVSTSSIMLDVLIALIPTTVFGIYNFGQKALFLVIATTLSAVLFEGLYQWLMKKRITVYDLSAAVTGLLLALNLPYDFPIWMAVIGSLFAIVIVKQVFGGLGQNFMNPALAARCFLLLSFGTRMTVFTYDGITGATPLNVLKNGGDVELGDMFFGTTAGTIGETSTIALLVGAVYLLIKKVISLKIPFVYILTFVLFIVIFTDHGFDWDYILKQVCGGGLILGAFYMATDYVTSPITPLGQTIYAIILGLLTGLFRMYGPNAEGVSYAIIFSNLLVPLIEKFTIPYAFGREKERFCGKMLYKVKEFIASSKNSKGGNK